MAISTPLTDTLDVELAVIETLCDFRLNGARHISFSALLTDRIGDDVTLGEAIEWLAKTAKAPLWERAAAAIEGAS